MSEASSEMIGPMLAHSVRGAHSWGVGSYSTTCTDTALDGCRVPCRGRRYGRGCGICGHGRHQPRTRFFLLTRLATGAHTDASHAHTTSRHNGTPFRALSTVCKESAARVACSSQSCCSSYDVLQQLMAVLLCSGWRTIPRSDSAAAILVFRRRLFAAFEAMFKHCSDLFAAPPCLLTWSLPCCFLLGFSLARSRLLFASIVLGSFLLPSLFHNLRSLPAPRSRSRLGGRSQ